MQWDRQVNQNVSRKRTALKCDCLKRLEYQTTCVSETVLIHLRFEVLPCPYQYVLDRLAQAQPIHVMHSLQSVGACFVVKLMWTTSLCLRIYNTTKSPGWGCGRVWLDPGLIEEYTKDGKLLSILDLVLIDHIE